jgi:hypothetical protein
MSNPSTEHRVTCANVKLPGHRQHAWLVKNAQAAEKTLRGFVTDRARLPASHWRQNEYPYKIQTRTVTKWEDAE